VDIDLAKIDDAVLALLYLTLHDEVCAWKGMDWGALGRLHAKGLIYDPVNKAKSVVFTKAGLLEAQRVFERDFVTPTPVQKTVRSGRNTCLITAQRCLAWSDVQILFGSDGRPIGTGLPVHARSG